MKLPPLFISLTLLTQCLLAGPPIIYVNQVAFESGGPKTAVVATEESLADKRFELIDAHSGEVVFREILRGPFEIEEWAHGKTFYEAGFSAFKGTGSYRIRIPADPSGTDSDPFEIGDSALTKPVIEAITQYYHRQRATTPEELGADRQMRLFGSDKTVDVHGGWCDASGDVSKYFSHLAYANVMSPQQTPLVVWSMVNAVDSIPNQLKAWNLQESLQDEALYGADYLLRSLSPDDYFYMTVFSYFKKDPSARRIVGLHADSVTTDEYQCAFREGGGMAIAALARISQWKRHGEFTSAQYLKGAKRAFAHLLVNNTKYDDDGRENIIDDYCALMAATELWIATGDDLYRDEARKRATHLAESLTPDGYFRANDTGRPFWHASDAGLPIIALARFVKKEGETALGQKVRQTMQRALDYQLRVTDRVSNPFGYPRQTFLFHGTVKEGFFIPHENETGWWWQGENARLGSLAAAALVGGRIVSSADAPWGVDPALAEFASRQVSWVLGGNPYSVCFLYGFGKQNVPYMRSSFGHGSEKGGISNGITGADGRPDGGGIDFKTKAKGNEWRWTEQWIPHAAWFLQVLTAIAEPNENVLNAVK